MERLERLLRPRETAALLGVALSTVYSWAADGKIPVQHVGRALRFSPRALEKWLAAQRREEAA